MSVRGLPNAATALASLRRTGNQFETAPLVPQPIERLTYRHPQHGKQTVGCDPRVLAATGTIYVNDSLVASRLTRAGGRVKSMTQITARLGSLGVMPELTWSVSGYASIGQDCSYEADILEDVYRAFLRIKGGRPSLICDGAAGAGVLGINGVLAEREGIPTLGITPYQGFSSMAPRKHMIVYGNTYQDREVIVGKAGDVLLVVGGGQGALRELIHAERAGCAMVLVGQRSLDAKSVAQSWHKHARLREAFNAGRLVLALNSQPVAAVVREAVQAARQFAFSRRADRIVPLHNLLHR